MLPRQSNRRLRLEPKTCFCASVRPEPKEMSDGAREPLHTVSHVDKQERLAQRQADNLERRSYNVEAEERS